MGYNATYGRRNLDSTYREPVKSVDGKTENFMETDELGVIHVKREFVQNNIKQRKTNKTKKAVKK